MSTKVVRLILATGAVFTGVAAVAGGIGLLVGWIPLPIEWLRGSPFNSYVIPGLALAIFAGGSSLLAAGMLFVHHSFGALAALAAGLTLVIFEIVEFAVVQYVSWMQPFFFGDGLLIMALAGLLWRTERRLAAQIAPVTAGERQLTHSST